MMKTSKVIMIIFAVVLLASHLLTAQTEYLNDDFHYTDSPLNHGWGFWWAGSDNKRVTLSTKYDPGVNSQVMDMVTNPSSLSYSVAYPGSWGPIEAPNPIIKFKFRTTTHTGGEYYFRVHCTNGNIYNLIFNLSFGTNNINGSDVNIFKGSSFLDGQWHDIMVDIKSELSQFVETDIEKIQYIVFYGDVRVDDIVVIDGLGSGVIDTDCPTPNPMAWSILPTATSSTSITMMAALASDPSGGIEYEFNCTRGGGPERTWDSNRTFSPMSPTYDVRPDTWYAYQVRARDAYGNMTSWSHGNAGVGTPVDSSSSETVWDTSGNNIYYNTGNVGIGTTELSDYQLNVNGTIRANEVIVSTDGADHVFSPNYNLITLEQIQNHIQEHQHLPGIPSAQEMIEKGMSVSEMQTKLLEKIEELTLYTIEQQKKIEALEIQVEALNSEKNE